MLYGGSGCIRGRMSLLRISTVFYGLLTVVRLYFLIQPVNHLFNSGILLYQIQYDQQDPALNLR